MKITIEIPGLPKMANGGRWGWQKAARISKEWKELVGWHLLGKAPPKPWPLAEVHFTRCSFTEPDFDGLVHGFKPLCDALVQYGFIQDDRPNNLVRHYHWQKAPRKSGKVCIELWPLGE